MDVSALDHGLFSPATDQLAPVFAVHFLGVMT